MKIPEENKKGTITIRVLITYPFYRVMEKSVKNAVFKGFPVLMESGTFGSKQDSQTTNKEINNSQGNFSRGFYLVPKCIEKKITVALVE